MVKIVILTQSTVLGQALAALLNAITEDVCIAVVKNSAAALEAVARQEPALIILDGGVSSDELTVFLRSRANGVLFPPILLLVESTEQEDLARREEVTTVLKGNAIAFVSAVEPLLFVRSDGGKE